ncbi:MAG: hypothetical protein GF350_00975 [Chitinivibrionales bacterium]|nr:hypothetical protein [Chitinivibrionales bacterium]
MIRRVLIISFIAAAGTGVFAQQADTDTSSSAGNKQSVQSPSNTSQNTKNAKPLEVGPQPKSNWSKIKDLFL